MSRVLRDLKKAILHCEQGREGRIQFRGMNATLKPYIPKDLNSASPFYYITGKPGSYRLCVFKHLRWQKISYGATYFSDGFPNYTKDVLEKYPPLYLVEFDKDTPYSERGYAGYGMTDQDVEWYSHKMGIQPPILVSRFGRGEGYRLKKRGYAKNVRHH